MDSFPLKIRVPHCYPVSITCSLKNWSSD